MTQEFLLRLCSGSALALSTIGIFIFAPQWLIAATLFCILSLIIRIEWPRFNAPRLTLFYPVFPFLCMIALALGSSSILLPFIIGMVWSFDTGAYFAGKLFGNHKICPSISPGKTWEGFMGGFLASLIFTSVVFYVTKASPSASLIVVLCLTTCCAATMGDLFESYLKRRAGIKDSGNSIPGHGGLLDRFDGIMGAVILLYPLRTTILTMMNLRLNS